MPRTGAHAWTFRARFRRHAFGWKSQPAIARTKEAVTEIRQVARRDPLLAADGAVLFLEKVSPALEHVDSSSGAIGTAVTHAEPHRMNRPQVAYFLSGVLAYFPSGAPTCRDDDPRSVAGSAVGRLPGR